MHRLWNISLKSIWAHLTVRLYSNIICQPPFGLMDGSKKQIFFFSGCCCVFSLPPFLRQRRPGIIGQGWRGQNVVCGQLEACMHPLLTLFSGIIIFRWLARQIKSLWILEAWIETCCSETARKLFPGQKKPTSKQSCNWLGSFLTTCSVSRKNEPAGSWKIFFVEKFGNHGRMIVKLLLCCVRLFGEGEKIFMARLIPKTNSRGIIRSGP